MSHPPARPEVRPSIADDRGSQAVHLDLLRTVPAECSERTHAEAIARLRSAQRESLLREVGDLLPPGERALAGPANATPLGIARLITRACRGRPDLTARLSRALCAAGAGTVLGGAIGGALLGGLVGGTIGDAAGDAVTHQLTEANPTGADAASTASGEPDLGGLFDL